MELTLVPLLLPAIQAQFDLSIGEVAWVFNSYGIAVAVGVLVGGWLGDVVGTRSVFGAGVFCFSLGSLLVAFASSFEALTFGRLVQGFGGGVFSPLIPILLTSAFPHRPGRVLILWGSISGYVAACAPLAYGGFLDHYSWTLAFFIFAAVPVFALAVSWTSPAPVVEDVARPEPSYLALLRSRELAVLYAYVFCTYGSITYYLFRLPLWLAENNFEVLNIGLILSVMWLSFSLASTLLRNAVDAPHVRTILLAAPVLIAMGVLLAYRCQDMSCLILASVLVGSGLACSNAPSTQLILTFAPKGMSAVSVSLDITFARLGGVATVALLAESQFVYAAVVIVLLCCFGFFCATLAGRHLGQRVAAGTADSEK